MRYRRAKNAAAFAVLAVSAVFIAAGILGGEYAEVLSKAVRICLECIGIG